MLIWWVKIRIISTPNQHLSIWWGEKMKRFLGREREQELLKSLLLKKIASLVVIRGRRRVGKSRLAEEFSQNFPKHYSFVGLAPIEGVTAQIQRDEFARQMRQQEIPCYGNTDWGDIFTDLAKYCEHERILIIFDEITWMAHEDPTFLGKLKTVWDNFFKKNNELILILSGSNSAWIEKNILSSTGFFGRISTRINLTELPLNICNQFWGSENHIASYEKFKILSITGGIPRYLEEINPHLDAETNIKHLCFEPEGLLFNEFDDIFNDLFDKRQQRFREIVTTLVDAPLELEAIATKLNRTKGGDLSEDLNLLLKDNFITRDHTWHISNGEMSKLSRYRLNDNYLRFYLKYILPNQLRIKNRTITELPPGWSSIMGLQFENLVCNNINMIIDKLKIERHEVLIANPYLQTQTKQRSKCQIDLMIQTKHNVLYLFEVKFSKSEIPIQIIEEMQDKVKRLVIPRGFSIRTVLIHVNGIAESVIEKDYFSHIIDFGDLLN